MSAPDQSFERPLPNSSEAERAILGAVLLDNGLISQAIDRLPDSYRDVFVLADVERLPNAEVADVLGLTVSAVKNRLHRARLLMRDALAPHFEEVAS